MLISVFKSNQKIINLLVVLLTLVLWLPSFFCETTIINYKTSLFIYIRDINKIKILNYLSGVLFISIQAIYLNNIANQQRLVKNNSHLTAFFYLLILSINESVLLLNPALIVNTIVIVILHQLLKLYNQTQINASTFNVGVLIGFATLLYFPAIILFPFLWFAIMYISTPNWRSFIVSILGFLIPILYFVIYHFYVDGISDLKNSFGLNNVLFNRTNDNNSLVYNYNFIIVLILVLIALIHLLKKVQFDVLKVRKSKILVFVLLVLSSIIAILPGNDFFATIVLMSTSLSIFLADFFNELKRKWLAELLFILLLGSVAINYFS